MSNITIANIVENGYQVALSNKPNAKGEIKKGSFARAIMFASKEVRGEYGMQMYAHWLANGNFKPLALDIVDVLVPKSAKPFVMGLVPPGRNISREGFLALCEAVNNAIVYSGKELKGQKAFLYGIVQSVLAPEQDKEFVIENAA